LGNQEEIMRRAVRLLLTLPIVGLLLWWPALVQADDDDAELKLEGVVDVAPFGVGSGGTLSVPVAAPTTFMFNFGVPTVQLAVTIDATTQIEAEKPLPVTLGDGDRVRLHLAVVNGAFFATELKVRAFPEIHLRGTAAGLPVGGLSLPLGPGGTASFLVNLGVIGADVPVQATADTKVEEGPITLHNGDPIRIEGFVQDFQVVITEIEGGEHESGEGGDD
jgi:hypothetical protein